MATAYRPPSTKIIPPAPPEYAENFAKGGWRLVERLYGARTDLHLKWQEMTGCVSRRKPVLPSAPVLMIEDHFQVILENHWPEGSAEALAEIAEDECAIMPKRGR